MGGDLRATTSRTRARTRAPAVHASTAAPDADADAWASPRQASMLALQRAAGNAAVAAMVGPQIVVQRGGAISEHTLSAAEARDMPAAEDANDLNAELWQLNARSAALEKAAAAAKRKGEPLPDEETRLSPDEKKRQAEVDRLVRIRKKGDEAETLRLNGQKGGLAAWFADVKSFTFLGKTINVHTLLADRLAKVEAALQSERPPPGGWMAEAPSALREPGQSLHSLGLAIDINPHTNPWLINPDAGGAAQVENPSRSRAIKNVIDRAVLLVTNQTARDADLQRRPKRDDAAERVDASYDKLQGASDALARYLTLDAKDKRKDLEDLVVALGANNPKGWDAKRWAKVIAADRGTLRDHADAKKWTAPTTGFLHLDKRLVKAMTGVGGLTWLGDDTIAMGRDIMHFDMRGVGPIHSIWDSAQGKATGLGNG